MSRVVPRTSRAETQRRGRVWGNTHALGGIAAKGISAFPGLLSVLFGPNDRGPFCGLCVSARAIGALLAVLGLLGAAWVGPVLAAEMVHGENSVFAGRGVAMAWAILKAPVEEQSQVVVRIARLDPSYVSLSVDGVDPFDQRRQEILGRTKLGEVFETRVARGTFAEFTRREFHFYTAADERALQPSLTVYFMGVPDTAPEFLAGNALWEYLDNALRKVQGGTGGRHP